MPGRQRCPAMAPRARFPRVMRPEQTGRLAREVLREEGRQWETYSRWFREAPGGNAALPNALPTRRIPVTKGIESDYYVEISGEGIEEGLEVVVPADNGMDDLNRLLQQMGPMGGF